VSAEFEKSVEQAGVFWLQAEGRLFLLGGFHKVFLIVLVVYHPEQRSRGQVMVGRFHSVLLTERSERLDAIMLLYTRNATGNSLAAAYSLIQLAMWQAKACVLARLLEL